MALNLYSTSLIAIVVVATGIASIKWGIPSAIIEAIMGIMLGNFLGVGIEPWLDLEFDHPYFNREEVHAGEK